MSVTSKEIACVTQYLYVSERIFRINLVDSNYTLHYTHIPTHSQSMVCKHIFLQRSSLSHFTRHTWRISSHWQNGKMCNVFYRHDTFLLWAPRAYVLRYACCKKLVCTVTCLSSMNYQVQYTFLMFMIQYNFKVLIYKLPLACCCKTTEGKRYLYFFLFITFY